MKLLLNLLDTLKIAFKLVVSIGSVCGMIVLSAVIMIGLVESHSGFIANMDIVYCDMDIYCRIPYE